MAATPKRSLTRTVASTVEGRSPRFLLGSLALAMVISLLAGLTIGMQIEQSRDHTKKAKAAKVVKPKRTLQRLSLAVLAKTPINMVVVVRKPKQLVVTRRARRLTMVLIARTRIEVISHAPRSDIKAGSRVLFALKPKSGTTTTGVTTTTGGTTTTGAKTTPTAAEIIVVTGTQKGRLGSVVTSVTADSMTLKGAKGPVTISTVGARILKTTRGARTNVAAGRRVIISAFLPKAPKKPKKTKKAAVRRLVALEIVVLPRVNAFG